MTLTTPPTGGADDPLVKLVAGLVLGAGLLGKFWPLIPAVKRRNQKKRDTDEHNALMIAAKSLELQEKLETAETALAIRDAQVTRLERDITALRIIESEVLVLRNVNERLERELKLMRGKKDVPE